MTKLLVSSIVVAALTGAVNAQCYYPDGSDALQTQLDGSKTGFSVCKSDSDDGFSSCCDTANDMCTTNGFCKAAADANNRLYWRNACTDPTFKSPNCAQHCTTNSAGDKQDTSQFVVACSATTYCCAPWTGIGDRTNGIDYSCCDDKAAVFDAGPANYLAGGKDLAAPLFPTTTTSSSASSTSGASSTTAASSGPAESSASSSTTASSFTTSFPSSASTSSTASLAAASSSSKPSADTSSSNDLGAGTKAGISIGAAAVVVIAVALSAWVILQYRKRRLNKRAPEATTVAAKEPMLYESDGSHETLWQKTGHVYETHGQIYEADSNWQRSPAEMPESRYDGRRELP